MLAKDVYKRQGQGYIALLKMLVMPLVFVAIVGAFTNALATENLEMCIRDSP